MKNFFKFGVNPESDNNTSYNEEFKNEDEESIPLYNYSLKAPPSSQSSPQKAYQKLKKSKFKRRT